MKELEGKRLLILGGSLWKKTIKQFAEDNNIVLVATGNDQSAGIFEIATEKYNVNSIDAVEMKKLIKEKNIDGVYMGGSETVISAACGYLNEMNMPCYCTKEQWNALQNKINFKKLCIQNNLPVVPQYEINENVISIDENEYPLIVKPADGCGSNGFSICKNESELKVGICKAKKNSPTESVIVEKYVENMGNVVFYTVSNGIIYFSGLSDKYSVQYKKQGSYVGGLFIYESKYTNEFRMKFEKKIQKMINSIGIKEGSFWIEVFHNKEQYYFNEVGYRYGGSASIYPTNYMYGINQVAMDMYYALTGRSKINGYKSMFAADVLRKKYYAVYPIHIKPGEIAKIEGVENIKCIKNIIEILIVKNIGDKVLDTGSFNQAGALIHIVFDKKEELIEIINEIHNKFKFLDTTNNNLVNRMLDVSTIKL